MEPFCLSLETRPLPPMVKKADFWKVFGSCLVTYPPKTNIAPENRPSQKGISSSNHHFQVLC